MRIGIDARPLVSVSPSGIGIYLLEILKNFNRNNGVEYVLYSNEPIKNPEPVLNKFEQHVIGGSIGTLAICFRLGKQLKEDRIDVFWGTEHMIPLNSRSIKKFLTVHDLALMINPSWGSRKNAVMQNVFCRLSCKCADRIIAVSEATKKDLIDLLRINENIVTVIPNGGYTDVTFSKMKIEDIEKKIGIAGKKFFSYIGNIEPRKNIIGIIKAFEKVNDRSSERYYLVLAGKMGWKTNPIKYAIEHSKYRDYIVLPGYISEEEKKYLMGNAIAFVFPSNYEGFGIPIVEAFSCGGIVITARNSSLTEVGGEAAFYIAESGDIDSLTQRMLDCIVMPEQERIERIQAGKRQAALFDWVTCAQKTQKILESM